MADKIEMVEVVVTSQSVTYKGGIFSLGSKFLVEKHVAVNLIRTRKVSCEVLEKAKKAEKAKTKAKTKTGTDGKGSGKGEK